MSRDTCISEDTSTRERIGASRKKIVENQHEKQSNVGSDITPVIYDRRSFSGAANDQGKDDLTRFRHVMAEQSVGGTKNAQNRVYGGEAGDGEAYFVQRKCLSFLIIM